MEGKNQELSKKKKLNKENSDVIEGIKKKKGVFPRLSHIIRRICRYIFKKETLTKPKYFTVDDMRKDENVYSKTARMSRIFESEKKNYDDPEEELTKRQKSFPRERMQINRKIQRNYEPLRDFTRNEKIGHFQRRLLQDKIITKDFALNMIFSDFSTILNKYWAQNERVLRMSQDTVDTILGLSVRQKYYIKGIFSQVVPKFEKVATTYFVRQQELLPDYQEYFDHGEISKLQLGKLRQQSHSRSVIDTYIKMTKIWDNQNEVNKTNLVLTRHHAALNLKLENYKHFYMTLIELLVEYLQVTLPQAIALFIFFHSISCNILEHTSKMTKDGFTSTVIDSKWNKEDIVQKRTKQVVWD